MLQSPQWTNEHCERCYDEESPQLKTHEIWCNKHYEEQIEETEETE